MLASTEKSLIILHSAPSFNLPLELHASEYEFPTLLSLLLLSESEIRARSQAQRLAQSVWGYFEVVMTVRTETTMRMGS